MTKKRFDAKDPYFSNWMDRFTTPYRYPSSCVITAIASPDHEFVTSSGHIDETVPQEPDINNLFEIGSITKVFTSILLAKLSQQNLIDPDMPVGRIMAELEGTPDWITPRNLASHASGLPAMPELKKPKAQIDPQNPYKDFSEKDLFQYMKNYRPAGTLTPGKVLYSNLGMGLLAQLLARVGGQDYLSMLRQEIFQPLDMIDTVLQPDDSQSARVAIPHDKNGTPPLLELDALAGAGALISTMEDMIKFSRAVMSSSQQADTLSAAIQNSLEVQISGADGDMQNLCLGWGKLSEKNNLPGIYYHNGDTEGSSAALFICPEENTAIIMLSNHKRIDERDYNPEDLIYELIGEITK